MISEKDIELILYGGTTIMLVLALTIIFMVYFMHRSLMRHRKRSALDNGMMEETRKTPNVYPDKK